MDATYDTRYKYNSATQAFTISGYSGSLPISIQNMPEEELGGVYGSGDGSLALISYAKEATSGSISGLSGASSSIFLTRNSRYGFAANQVSHVLTVFSPSGGSSLALSLPGVYRVSVNPGGSVALAFVQNSNYAYYVRQLSTAQSIAYSGGSSTWPQGAQDCEPMNAPSWCLFQMQSPDGTPVAFDRPVKAVFSADGSTAYILNCGPECGGTASSVSVLPTAPLIFLQGQSSGSLPATDNVTTIPVPGGASNALVASSTMYVVGQQMQSDGLFTGNLTLLNLTNGTAGSPISISDGTPGGPSRLLLADDNTLWIGMTKCNNGERFATGQAYGCLTMFNTSSNTVTMLEPYLGDLTGIAWVQGLHKIYVAQGGQVYIYSTTDGSAINNQYVTVKGTAWDVAYMDATTDGNNTVY